jgi:hypothetical protein
MKRRHFLQFTSATLASLGLSQTDFLRQAAQCDRALAAPDPEGQKLALLIGVNHYPTGIASLQGCITDLELQHELLVHRYGFDSQNIRILADKLPQYSRQTEIITPTYDNIIAQIEQHLIQRARPGDRVVIHFSGHGAQLAHPTNPGEILYTLVPTVPPGDRQTKNLILQTISGKTLFMLRELINTTDITLILDSCYSGSALRGNAVRFRTLSADGPRLAPTQIQATADLRHQAQLLQRIRQTRPQWQLEQARPNAKGILLGAVQGDQKASDNAYHGGNNGTFYAGAFSYLLTQYLWQLSRPRPLERIQQDLQATYQVYDWAVQPEMTGADRRQPIYFQAPLGVAADAVIRAVAADGSVDYWLGGQSPFNLLACRPNTIWTVFDRDGTEMGQIQQQSRLGLTAKGKVLNPKNLQAIAPGMLLQQRVRLIPADFKLLVGKHPQLDLTNPQAAELWRAIAALPKIQPVEDNTIADCLLGQINRDLRQAQPVGDRPQADKLTDGSLGLLTSTHRLLTDTFGKNPRDLIPERLKHLVAVKYIKQILRSQSLWGTDLDGIREVNQSTQQGLISAVVPLNADDLWQTPRQFELPRTSAQQQDTAAVQLQINVHNQTKVGLYIIAITISSHGKLGLLYPQTEAKMLDPSDKLKDKSVNGQGYPLKGKGTAEILVLALEDATVVAEFLGVLKQLIAIRTKSGSETPAIITTPSGDQAIQLATDFLSSLNRTTRSRTPIDSPEQAIELTAFRHASHRITAN